MSTWQDQRHTYKIRRLRLPFSRTTCVDSFRLLRKLKGRIAMKHYLNLSVAIIFLLLTGCAHSIHQYSVGDSYPSEHHSKQSTKGREITAEAEQFVILHLAFNTDYADEAYRKLISECPNGEIIGINARYSTSLLFLSYKNKVFLQALCTNEG